MDVRCEKCGTEYEFDEDRIGPNGVTVKCTACGHVFKVLRKQKSGGAASTAAGDWLVKKGDGQVVAFKQLTTLQKWIVEGRITRDDEISRNSETWKRLGNIGELEPFFAVFDKAEALNELVAAGQVTGMERPLSLDGSAMLSASNPADSADTVAPSPAAAVVAGLSEVTAALEPSFAPPTVDPAKTRSMSPSPKRPSNGAPSFAAPAPTADLVESFARDEKRRRVLAISGPIAVVGLLGGAFLAWYGLQGPSKIPDLRKDPALARAYSAFDKDSLESLAEAAAAFESARKERPDDPGLAGDHALVLTTRAAALRRTADDDDARAQLAANELAAWAQTVAAREAAAPKRPKKDRDKDKDPPLPPRPIVPAPERLHENAARLREDASKTLKQALEIAKNAYARAPDAVAPSRALADYYRVQKDARVETFLGIAKKALNGSSDPAITYIEAAALYAKGPANTIALTDAVERLDRLSRERPEMVRAKALLGRAALLLGQRDRAKSAFEAVLATSPRHEEASRLLELMSGGARKAAHAEPPLAAVADAGQAPDASEAPQPNKPEPDKPEPNKPEPNKPEPNKPEPNKPEPNKPEPNKPEPDLARPELAKPDPYKKGEEVPAARRCATYPDCMRAGDHYRSLGEPIDALLAYERAADRRPNAPQAFIGMAWSYLDQNKTDAALVQFRRAERINEELPEIHVGKGSCFEKLGQKDEATAAYRRAIELKASGPTLKLAQKALERLGAN
ncbi:MAG: zinc-ribbon domain-containing protein [Deltaproteobacteria bacterium]|nr:zinc-ribbon domain-containing protein [Deltaproteobacteria bacterium]